MSRALSLALVGGFSLALAAGPEDDAVVALRALSATIERDATRPGRPVVGVNL